MTRLSNGTGGAMTIDARAPETGGVRIRPRYGGGGTGVVLFLDRVNSQLPTPNSQGEQVDRWGGRRSNKPVRRPFTPLSSSSPWELGVGGWELTVPRDALALPAPK